MAIYLYDKMANIILSVGQSILDRMEKSLEKWRYFQEEYFFYSPQ